MSFPQQVKPISIYFAPTVPGNTTPQQSVAPTTQEVPVNQEVKLSEAQKPFLAYIESLIAERIEGCLVAVSVRGVKSESLSANQDLEKAIRYLLDGYKICEYAQSPRSGEFLIRVSKQDMSFDNAYMTENNWTIHKGVCEHGKAFDPFWGEKAVTAYPIPD